MDKEIRKEAIRKNLRYFMIWFIITGIVVVLLLGTVLFKTMQSNLPRLNTVSPQERVYDYADVLTDREEEELRAAIAEAEKQSHADIIIVTLNEPMGVSDSTWEWNMMNYADDFYDDGKYGWNKAYGDGALLLDNWYEDAGGSQKGSWLSTSGKMEDIIGRWEESQVLDEMYEYIDSNPYRAYLAAVTRLRDFGRYGATSRGYGENDTYSGLLGALVISTIVAVCYFVKNLTQIKAKDTTLASTYVEGGVPAVRSRSDEFLRKSVTSHRIESSSGGGGGGGSRSHSGGGSHGHHTSSGGHSHGGGGRRR
ncbi:MAG: TPM domain-containing protein [Acetatifactor sp.]|nr:TPM domain-containing protein [Acetatifactor sp.]